MTPYIGCDTARELLQPFVDEELALPEQVSLEAHLRWCATCRARVEDMRLIGASIRLGSPMPVTDDEASAALVGIQAGVLARVRAERDQSWPVRLSTLFEDMHFMWPALGASVALTICVFAVLGINQATRAIDPDSMADRLQTLASPGSDRNPVHLDAWMLAPGLLIQSPVLEATPANQDETIALAVAVTREGRVATYEVLQGDASMAPDQARAVNGMLDVVRHARFTPAQTGAGPVAVNVVWVLDRTTVTARGGPAKLGAIAPLQPVPDVVVRPISDAPAAEPPLHPARS
jgi:hypothetical protein